jgi:Putative beta-barrel porin 2
MKTVASNQSSPTRSGSRYLGSFLWLCAVVLANESSPARADGIFTPYAAEQIEHNTNVFDLAPGTVEPLGKNGPAYGDTYFEERVGADGSYQLGQQQFFGTAEFRHFNYDNFTVLNHNEELFDGGLKWKVSQEFDGSVEYRHEQRMVLFQDLEPVTSLILETENDAKAAFNFSITPEWRLQTKLEDHLLDSPRVEVPGLSLHEDSVTQGLRYLGVANLSAGLDVQYLEGKYNHDVVVLDPNYHQVSVWLAAAYQVSGLTNLNATLGYTQRDDPTSSGLTGITGNIVYQRALSAKTSLNLRLARAVNSYLTTSGSELDTTAGASVSWQATYKLRVRVDYSYTYSRFPLTPVLTPDGSALVDRLDHYQTGKVDVTYQVLHWLSIRPYVKYEARHTNVPFYAYDSNVIGIEFLAKQPPRTGR